MCVYLGRVGMKWRTSSSVLSRRDYKSVKMIQKALMSSHMYAFNATEHVVQQSSSVSKNAVVYVYRIQVSLWRKATK